MINTAYKKLRNLMQRLSLVPTTRQNKTRPPEYSADRGDMSRVQKDTARAARKNPWILAG
jgi:hypothetical protein